MHESSWIICMFIMLCICRSSSQTTPIYGNSPLFQTRLVLTSIPTGFFVPYYNFAINPVKSMSTQNYRRPFIALTSAQKLQTQININLNMLTEISYSSTSFTIEFSFIIIDATTIRSWTYNTYIKFYYMVVDSAFPDTYISRQLEIYNTTTTFTSAPQSKFVNVDLNTWIGTIPFQLSAADTKFIYAITSLKFQSLTTNNKFSVSLKFQPISIDEFEVTVKTEYNQKIHYLRVSLFIYNQPMFNSHLIKITSNYYISPIMPLNATYQYQAYSSWPVYPGMQLILGLGGFTFYNQTRVGFEFSVDTSTVSPILTLGVKNFWSATVIIPKLQVTLFSISQLQCPNNELYINTALTECYTVCPSGTIPSLSVLGVTLLKTCQVCVIGTSGCCAMGKYWDSNSWTCEICQTGCNNCLSASFCYSCDAGYYKDPLNSCIKCATGCLTCDSTSCSVCQLNFILTSGYCLCETGLYFSAATSTCQSCSIPLPGCTQCASITSCFKCASGYYLSLSGCIQCSANCRSCGPSGCLMCQNGFVIYTDPAGPALSVCGTCAVVYHPQCDTCNQTKCITCSQGYFLRAALAICQALSTVVCGDGDWVQEVQACDDKNVINGDGCNSQCKVQQDYSCSALNALLFGPSFCIFTKQFTMQLISLEKDISSNTAQFFFKLQPSTFTQWTQSSVQSLLHSIELVKPTGVVQLIPISSFSLVFRRNVDINEIELVIDYGSYNLEDSNFQFNIYPSSASIASISHFSQNKLQTKVNSGGTGFYLYNYDQDTYNFQSLIQIIGTGVGGLALFMLLLGFCIPIGKLIILEALAVVQISYFSLLQFEKVPPTFIGLKNLIFSNGYNDMDMFFSTEQSYQDIFKLMGLKVGVLSNDNISLVMLLILPILVGLIGFLVNKCLQKKKIQDQKTPQSPQSQQPNVQQKGDDSDKKDNPMDDTTFVKVDENDIKDSVVQQGDVLLQVQGLENINDHKLQKETQKGNQEVPQNQLKQPKQNQQSIKQEQQQNLNLAKIIFQRILYELTFYGIFVTAYLSWVSILHSFSQIQIPTYLVLGFILIISSVYGVLFMKLEQKSVQINKLLKQSAAKNKIFPQKHLVWTKFGQFGQVFDQITPFDQNNCPKLIQKIYLVFLVERLLSSALIVFLPSTLNVTSVFLLAIYGTLFAGLIVIYQKSRRIQQPKIQNQNQNTINAGLIKQQDQTPKNSINPSNQKSLFSFLHKNYLLRQGINLITIIVIQIIYIYTSIVIKTQDHFDTFVNNSIITKGIPIAILSILFISLMFNLFQWFWQLKSQKIIDKIKLLFAYLFPKTFEEQLVKKKLELQILNQTQMQEAEVIKMLNKFMKTSAAFQSKDNPFGIEEKQKQQAGGALLDLLKIEEKQKFKIPQHAKKLRNRLIDEFWDQI